MIGSKRVLKTLTERASDRADLAGAKVEVMAIASIRSTSETHITQAWRNPATDQGHPAEGRKAW